MGGYKQAEKEFDKVTKGLNVELHPDGVKSAVLPNGDKISVRRYSTEGSATIQIDRAKNNKRIKIRYK